MGDILDDLEEVIEDLGVDDELGGRPARNWHDEPGGNNLRYERIGDGCYRKLPYPAHD